MLKFSTGMIVLAGVLIFSPATRAEIVLDFSDDAAADNFFGMATTESMQARAAVLKAAADINEVLNATLDPIPTYQAQGTAPGSFGGTNTATFNGSLRYSNPSTGVTETFNPMTLAANEVRVFVGARNLSDTMDASAPINNVLGQGGPGSVGGSSGGSGFGSFVDAVAQMEANANALFGRGGNGPVIATTVGTLGGVDYSVEFTSTLGNLWFDSDTDNDGELDTASELSSFWHFDANSATVPNTKIDFYSVALHEILHAIGIGTAESWDDLVSPFVNDMTSRDWMGANVIALAGSGDGLIDPAAGHIQTGTISTRLSDGASQEVVMDPNIAFGQRKELTALDVAFLQDIGWANASAIPEPTMASLLSLTMLLAATRRRRI